MGMAFGCALFLLGDGVTVAERMRAVWSWAAGLPPKSAAGVEAGAELARRRTLALPSIFAPYGAGLQGTDLPKPTQANLRRFAETPVVRRAINVIKDRVVAMDWQVRVRRGINAGEVAGREQKLQALRRVLEEPNATDSFRTLL